MMCETVSTTCNLGIPFGGSVLCLLLTLSFHPLVRNGADYKGGLHVRWRLDRAVQASKRMKTRWRQWLKAHGECRGEMGLARSSACGIVKIAMSQAAGRVKLDVSSVKSHDLRAARSYICAVWDPEKAGVST
jgi:hypothetical protein